jgi:hypothetical protein
MMTQNGSRKSVRNVLLAGLALVALGLATVVLLSANVAVSEAQSGDIPLDRGRLADAERLTRAADFYLTGGRSRARAAEAARLTGLAERFSGASESDCVDPLVTRSRQAYAARLGGQAAHYLGSPVVRTPVLNRGRIAESRRLTEMALRLDVEPEIASSVLACFAGS